MNTIGENIVTLRKRKGISQGDLANELFVTPQAISRWERGETEPDIETIKKLCVILDSTLDDLICGVSSPLTKKQENIFKYVYIVASVSMIFLTAIFTVLAVAFKISDAMFIVIVTLAILFLASLFTCEVWKLKKQRKLDEALKSEDAEK